MDKLLILFQIVFLANNNLHYLFYDVMLVMDLIPLWLTSLNFRCRVNEEIELIKLKKKHTYSYKSIHLYRKLAKLSRFLGEIHGLHLLYYFLFSTLYYSSTFDEIFSPEGYGYKFYRVQYMCVILAFQWISSNFYKNVENIQYKQLIFEIYFNIFKKKIINFCRCSH